MNGKQVIYVDVEDEITSIIDKVNSSKNKVVALVLPKRATVFQSIVNMKLLKRKADDAKKNVVLVTSEAGLLPLAGAVGIHVAKTLEAKPMIPPGPDDLDEGPIDADGEPPEEVIDNTTPVGELAGAAAVGAVAAKSKRSTPPKEDDAIEVDNESDSGALAGASAAAAAGKAKKSKKPKSDGKFKIPDFNKFRKSLIIGGITLVVLILAYIFMFKVWPKATIIIKTNTSSVNTSVTATLDSSASSVNAASDVLPARIQTISKTAASSPVTTTGQKTVGTLANGTITVTDNNCGGGANIPAGTQFTDSSGNFVFASSAAETIAAAQPEIVNHKPVCTTPSVNIPVTASNVGSNYNIASTSYTTTDSDLSGFNINGTNMSGGSSQVVQVVAQADVDTATKAITAPTVNTIQQQLEQGLTQAGFQPVSGTYVAGNPTYTPSAAVGTQANSVTVTETIVYTMYGVRKADADTLLTDNVNRQIDTSKQSILNSGTSTMSFTVANTTATSVQGTLSATSTVGPILNINTLKTQSAGQRSGDIKSSINSVPGVTSVTVKYSPFWVTSTPKNVHKITIVIQKANGSAP